MLLLILTGCATGLIAHHMPQHSMGRRLYCAACMRAQAIMRTDCKITHQSLPERAQDSKQTSAGRLQSHAVVRLICTMRRVYQLNLLVPAQVLELQ